MRDLNSDDFNHFMLWDTAIRKITFMHGLPQLVEQDSHFLFDFAQAELSGYTFDDMVAAAYWNCSGKSEANIQGFGKMSAKFLGELMLAYEPERQNRAKKAISQSGLMIGEGSVLPIQERRKNAYNGLIEFYKKEGNWPITWPYELALEHLQEMKPCEPLRPLKSPESLKIETKLESLYGERNWKKMHQESKANIIKAEWAKQWFKENWENSEETK
jgi:hypothetical protein